MAFGVTIDGFVAKRLADIKTEIENDFKATFGSGINLDARGPFGQIIGIMAEREAEIWELSEEVYNSRFPQNASGIGVDNALSLVGLTRKQATASVVTLKLFGDVGTLIPSGSQVSKSDDATVVFQTTGDATILAGSGVDEVQKIMFSAVPDSGDWELDFDGQVTSTLAFNITAGQLQTELENLSNIGAGNVSVTGNFTSGFTITFQGSLEEEPLVQLIVSSNTLLNGVNPVTATPSTLTEGVFPFVEQEALCLTLGSVAAPSGTLTVIETPVSGWDSVTNALDATQGQDIETDADAKVRRTQSLAFPGHSTLNAIVADLLQVSGVVAVRVFENTSMITDLSGRPAKSYEAVVQGGDDADIASVMFLTKPVGIQQVGSETETVVDSQGFSHDVKFSRPTPVNIYLILDLTTNAEYPINGDDLVEAAILEYGNALNIGDDVIVVPQLVCALHEIPGILDVEVRVGVTTLPTPGSNAVTFTNDLGDLRVDFTGHVLTEGDRVKFTTTGTLPSGITAGETYWVRNPAPNEFFLSDERGGDVLPFISGGSGTHTISFGGLEDNITIEEFERAAFDSSRITVNS